MDNNNLVRLGGDTGNYVAGIRNGENMKNIFRHKPQALRAYTIGTIHRLPTEMIKHMMEVCYSELCAREAFPENRRGLQK